MDTDAFQEIRESLEPTGGVVLVVGTGVSIACTKNALCASWPGLLRAGAQEIERLNLRTQRWLRTLKRRISSRRTLEWIRAASDIEKALGWPNDERFAAWLMRSVGSLPTKHRRLANAILALESPIITTNYDGILEGISKDHSFVTWKDVPSLIRDSLDGRRFKDGLKRVLHIHGYYQHPDSVVFGRQSYNELLRTTTLRHALRSSLYAKRYLFIGCGAAGLLDPHFSRLLQWFTHIFKGQVRPSVLVTEEEYRRFKRLPYHLHLIIYGTSHDQLPKALESLAPARPRGVQPSLLIPASPMRVKHYTRKHALAFREGRIGDALAAINKALHLHPDDPEILRDWVKTAIRCDVSYRLINHRITAFTRLHGTSAQVRLAAAELARREGRYARVIKLLTSDVRSLYTRHRGKMLYELGFAHLLCYCHYRKAQDLQMAIQYLERSDREKPGRYWVAVNLAFAQRIAGTQNARLERTLVPTLKSYIKRHPLMWSARLYLVLALAILQDFRSLEALIARDARIREQFPNGLSFRQLASVEPRIQAVYRRKPILLNKCLTLVWRWSQIWTDR